MLLFDQFFIYTQHLNFLISLCSLYWKWLNFLSKAYSKIIKKGYICIYHFDYFIFFVDNNQISCQTTDNNQNGLLSKSSHTLSVIFSLIKRSRSSWWGKRIPCICYCLQLLHESYKKENLMVCPPRKISRIIFIL